VGRDHIYFDVQEDKPFLQSTEDFHSVQDYVDSFNDVEEDEVVRFGDDAPGDRIHLFHEERQKFFSIMSDGAPGSLFILPLCFFDFLFIPSSARLPGCGASNLSGFENFVNVIRLPIEHIKMAIRPANRLGVALSLLGQGEFEPGQIHHFLVDIAHRVYNVDAFRIVAREMFYFRQGKILQYRKGIKSHLAKVIEFSKWYILRFADFEDDDGEANDSFFFIALSFQCLTSIRIHKTTMMKTTSAFTRAICQKIWVNTEASTTTTTTTIKMMMTTMVRPHFLFFFLSRTSLRRQKRARSRICVFGVV
jgi:hypothetical protein